MFGPLFNNGAQENIYDIDVKQSLWINTAQVLALGATSAQSSAVALAAVGLAPTAIQQSCVVDSTTRLVFDATALDCALVAPKAST